jgi:hypothetical protein
MSDLAIAGMLFSFLVALALAAPIWGHDSRDGIESDQSSRRVAWLYDRPTAPRSRPAGVMLAGALRVAARHLDQDVVLESEVERQLARAV